jgi:hypothetical protein
MTLMGFCPDGLRPPRLFGLDWGPLSREPIYPWSAAFAAGRMQHVGCHRADNDEPDAFGRHKRPGALGSR